MTRTLTQSSTATSTLRTAIYVRISLDMTGQKLGVKRQEEDCRAYCKARGMHVVEVYVDNDVSATSNKIRPEWQRLLADVRAGSIDAIVVWHIDRMTRKPRELEDVIDLADAHGLQLGTVTGDVDLATPTGRMVARIMGAAARHEAEHKGERQRRALRQAAEAGRPKIGGRRAFGYDSDGVTVRHDEAEIIREAARRVLAGETLRSVAIDLNERGIRTTMGGQFSGSTIRTILVSARISGRREVGRVSAKGIGEIVAVDCWEPIISVTDNETLRAMLGERRSSNPAGRRTRKHLLSGLLVCDNCGANMQGIDQSGVQREHWSKATRALVMYRCPPPGSLAAGSCGRMTVHMRHVETYVRNVLLAAIDSPDFRDRLNDRADLDPAVSEQIRRDEAELVDIASDRAEGLITRSEWATMRSVIDARLTANRSLVARASKTTALSLLDGDDEIEKRWDALNLAQQRAIVAEVFDELRVITAPKTGRNKFDGKKRVSVRWRF